MNSKYLIWLLFLSLSAACKTPSEKGNDSITIKALNSSIPKDFKWVLYDYGGPPEPYFYKAQKEVWKRYNIEIEGFGCMVTEALLHDIKLHNDSLFALLQPKYPGLSEDRVIGEMQDYVTTQKSIEGTIKPYLKKVIRHCVEPFYYPDIEWQPADNSGKVFLVKVFLEEPKSGDRQKTEIEMKVTPSTNDYLVKNDSGQWVEL